MSVSPYGFGINQRFSTKGVSQMSIAAQMPTETSRLTTGVSLGLIALAVIGFVVWITHNGAAARAVIEQQRSDEIAAESRAFCEKWGMASGTQQHIQCVADLRAIRERHIKRTEEDYAF